MPQFLVFLLFVFSVIQSPSNYATDKLDAVTQFKLAGQYGTLGLMAHNTKAGRYFDQLKTGDSILVIYADRNQEYKITTIERYQALEPLSVYSEFVSLGDSSKFRAGDLFMRIYGAKDKRLVLQTCIAANGNTSWGRLFIIAYPVEATK